MNQEILNQLKIEKAGFIIVGVFGSFARGEEREDSDLDMLFEDSESFRNKYKGLKRVYQLEFIRSELQKKITQKSGFGEQEEFRGNWQKIHTERGRVCLNQIYLDWNPMDYEI